MLGCPKKTKTIFMVILGSTTFKNFKFRFFRTQKKTSKNNNTTCGSKKTPTTNAFFQGELAQLLRLRSDGGLLGGAQLQRGREVQNQGPDGATAPGRDLQRGWGELHRGRMLSGQL